MNNKSKRNLYQDVAQELLDIHSMLYHEYGRGRHRELRLAKRLYEEHGPFVLEWHERACEPEEWYDIEEVNNDN